jgi:hypothetical protein
MSRTRVAAVVALSCAAVSLASCGTFGRSGASSRVTPDEFRVVTKAPLVVPPDYALRPPAPGEPRPQELAPESAARTALLGQRGALTRSPGENLLVGKAGAQSADPLIRYVVDDEFGDIAHKEKGWADRVLFWRRDEPGAAAAPTAAQTGGTTAAPVDAAAEAARLAKITGNKPVVIRRERPARFKLPGL